MIVKTLKETLNGGYNGLYGEVATDDCYRLRSIEWEPQLIFDLGANVGVFARYARSLFPKAQIISVEPDPENCVHFRKFTPDRNTHLIEAAVGKGDIWHFTNAANGAMEVYVCEGLGYPASAIRELVEKELIEKIRLTTLLLRDLTAAYWKPGNRTILKVDIEGAENALFNDPDSIECLKQMDYIAMEIHFHAHTGQEMPEVKAKTMQALHLLLETHECELRLPHFWANKR